jgi:hypothetical protein
MTFKITVLIVKSSSHFLFINIYVVGSDKNYIHVPSADPLNCEQVIVILL